MRKFGKYIAFNVLQIGDVAVWSAELSITTKLDLKNIT